MQPSPRVARGHTFGEMHRAGDRTNRHLIVLTEWLPLEGRHVLPLGGHVMHGEAHRELDAVGFYGGGNIPADLHGFVFRITVEGQSVLAGNIRLRIVIVIRNVGDIPMIGIIRIPFVLRHIVRQSGFSLMTIVDAIGDVAHTDISDVGEVVGLQRVLLIQLFPRFGLAIVILAFAQLDIDMLRDFKIAVGGGGHIVIKRAVAQVGTICAENQGTGTECGKNQRTDKA